MKTIFATYLGKGRLEARGQLDIQLLEDTYPIGSMVKLKTTRPRSHKQLNYFFAWLAEVFGNLPEDCPETFKSSEHLRAWLLYKTGHCKVVTCAKQGIDTRVINLLRRMSGKHLFFEQTDTTLFVFEPDSVAMENMPHDEFTEFLKQAEVLAASLIPDLDLGELDRRARHEQD